MMKHIYVLTGNQGKFKDIQTFLESHSIIVEQVPVELDELQDVDPVRIIHHKVKEALKSGYTNFVLEDTSLYIDGLNQLPGPLIKWFLQELGVDGLYKLACQMGNQSATVQTIVAYVDDQKQTHLFMGTTLGKIVAPRGELGFGWSAVFQPTGSAKTFGEMTHEEKAPWGQRIKALQKFLEFVRAR